VPHYRPSYPELRPLQGWYNSAGVRGFPTGRVQKENGCAPVPFREDQAGRRRSQEARTIKQSPLEKVNYLAAIAAGSLHHAPHATSRGTPQDRLAAGRSAHGEFADYFVRSRYIACVDAEVIRHSAALGARS
jgi:hypothetical protein